MADPIVFAQQIVTGRVESSSQPIPAGATLLTVASTMSTTDAGNVANTAFIGAKFLYDRTIPQVAQHFAPGSVDYAQDPAWNVEWQGGPNPKGGNPKGPFIGPQTMPVLTDSGGNPILDSGGNPIPPIRVLAWLDPNGNTLNTGLSIAIQ